MEPIIGYTPGRTNRPPPPLPAGAYVAVIFDVQLQNGGLYLKLDISEGPHTGYFTRATSHALPTSNGVRPWKGTFCLRLPVMNTEGYEPLLRDFEEAMWAIEQSNPGYQWNWNEQSLKGLMTGISVITATSNDPVGNTARIVSLESAPEVRAGLIHPQPKCKSPNPKPAPAEKEKSGNTFKFLF